jgi:Holliday junction resolvase RusA-like endonuclease
MFIAIPFAVQPHKRPRLGKGRVYQPKQVNLISYLKTYRHEHKLTQLTGKRLKLEVTFGFKGSPHIDIDNCCKATMDALMDSGIIKDDADIYYLIAEKLTDQSRAITLITLEVYDA